MGDAALEHSGDSADYETDEECLLQVSVSGILQEDLSQLTRDQFSFLDIQSDRPLVTIGNQVFVGEYQDTVGTSVFFTQAENTTPRDQVFSHKPGIEVKYLNSTRKKLVLKQVFLNKKTKSVKEKGGARDSDQVSQSKGSVGRKTEQAKCLERKKDVKTSKLKPHILFSGLDSSTCKEVSAMVTSLNGIVTDTPMECSHLVMDKLVRTDKMMMCLPVVKYILSLKWISDSDLAGDWVGEDDYFLRDPEMEERFGFDLKKTLAMTNREQLFNGKVFYLTPSIQSSHPALASIITHSGGRVESRRRSLEQMKMINSGETVNYIIITSEDDLHTVADVLKAGQGVFSAEFVFSAVTRGEMDFDLSNYIDWG